MPFGDPHLLNGAGIAMGRKGRAGVVLPFGSIVKISGFVLTFAMAFIALAIWGIMIVWRPLCYSVVVFEIVRRVRKKRKVKA